MKTLRQMVKQHGIAVANIPLRSRAVRSILMIVLYITLIITNTHVLLIGFIIALISILHQIEIGAWELSDNKWMMITFVWYIALYSTIAALFI